MKRICTFSKKSIIILWFFFKVSKFQENIWILFRHFSWFSWQIFTLSQFLLSHILLQFDNQPKMTRAVVDEIKKMTTDVISDRKFCKAMACYVQEEKRYLFSVTVFDGKAQFSASPKIGKIMEEKPDVMELLKGVFWEAACSWKRTGVEGLWRCFFASSLCPIHENKKK